VRGDDLLADRFFLDVDGQWRDVATGRLVDVVRRAVDARWPAWERACVDEWHDPQGGRLVDFGRTGADGWFEARLKAGRRAAIDPEIAAATAAAIERTMSGGGSHVRVGRRSPRGPGAALCVAARAARLAGYVPVRASRQVRPAVDRALGHRHLAFLVCGERDRSPVAACWWRAASIAPRHHLVVDCSPPPGSVAAD
jgi:hypothetical protein